MSSKDSVIENKIISLYEAVAISVITPNQARIKFMEIVTQARLDAKREVIEEIDKLYEQENEIQMKEVIDTNNFDKSFKVGYAEGVWHRLSMPFRKEKPLEPIGLRKECICSLRCPMHGTNEGKA